VSLSQLINNPATDIHQIARYLDGLDGAARWDQVQRLDRDEQRTLYEKAAASPPTRIEDFADGAAPLEEVIHDGLNTLPLPSPLRRFQKRFCRPERSIDARLYGYNEGVTRRFVGPGYFVAIPTRGTPAWEARGAIVVDYYQVPDDNVPATWPEVHPNSWRLQRFVYNETRDFMRKVSQHVTIGAAFKREKPLDHYFVLVRRT
jgi:hypothetical protein